MSRINKIHIANKNYINKYPSRFTSLVIDANNGLILIRGDSNLTFIINYLI
jgi:hypothetical protein